MEAAASGPPFPVRHKKLSLDIKGNNTDIIICSYDDHFLVSGDILYPWIRLWLCVGAFLTSIILERHNDVSLMHWLAVIATQIGSMGTIISARKEEEIFIEPTFNVNVIFGKRDEPLLGTCARQLIEHISNAGSSRPLVLSLGLKDHSVGTLKGIVSAVIENRLW